LKMNNRLKISLSLIVCSAFMFGCSLIEPRIEYRDKIVPVYTVPKPPKIERPTLPIHDARYRNPTFVSNPDNLGQIVQDYVISVRLLINYAEALNEIVETYRVLSERDNTSPLIPQSDAPLLMGSPLDGDNSPQLDERTLASLQLILFSNMAFSTIIDKYEEREREIINSAPE